MEYKRKPLTSYNQIPQQKIKKHDVYSKSNDYKLNDLSKNKEKIETKIINEVYFYIFYKFFSFLNYNINK